MKNVFIAALFLVGFQNFAQVYSNVDNISTSLTLNYGETVSHEEYTIEFKKLVSESRCPKDVTCVRAGEAKLIVSVYKSEQFIKDVELTIYATPYVSESHNVVITEDDYNIYGATLTPYPVAKENISTEDYVLKLIVQTIVKE